MPTDAPQIPEVSFRKVDPRVVTRHLEPTHHLELNPRHRVHRVRILGGLLVAALLSIAAAAAIVGLVVRATSNRGAQLQLDDFATEITQLQNTPWRILAAPARSHRGIVADLSSREAAVERQLSRLQDTAAIPELGPLAGMVRRNFEILDEEAAVLASGTTSEAQTLEPGRFESQDEITATVSRADGAYRDAATAAELDAEIGSGLIILLLLAGFAFSLRRAFLARIGAETLAVSLAESQAHLQQAQTLAGMGSWEWDLRTDRLTCSREHSRMHGWPDSVLHADADTLMAAIVPDDRSRVLAALTAPATPDQPVRIEYRVTAGTDERLIQLEAEFTDEVDGEPTRLIGICQDVTDRLRRVEAERANQAKSEFLSRMSHGLRTPLNAILGFGQLLSMDELDERQSQNVERIVAGGRQLLDMINDVLDISQIETGQLQLSPEPVNVGGVIADAVGKIYPLAITRSIEIVSEPAGADLWAKADLQRLGQVLLNLLSNAIKYNHDHGRVEVGAEADAERVRIVVADQGPGIAESKLARLFQPFDRLDAEELGIEGTGLGLAVSKGMVEAMGGTITVESRLGEGTTVTIELEYAEPQRHVAALDIRRSDPELPGSHVVLCIEDNPSNTLLIERVLSMRPQVTLIGAGTGTQGIELARGRQPMLVLLDLNLPDLNGATVLARLKADPGTRDLRVVVLSANAGGGHAEQLIEAGADAYLTKPIDIPDLLAVVDDALQSVSKVPA